MIRQRLGLAHARKVGGLGLAIVLLLGVAAMPATGKQGPSSNAASGWSFQGETTGPADIDAREGVHEPSAAQRSLVTDMGAEVRWKDFGTPGSLIRHGSWLATGLASDPVDAARSWIADNRALFRLSTEGMRHSSSCAGRPSAKEPQSLSGKPSTGYRHHRTGRSVSA